MVPFVDLKTQYFSIKSEIDAAVARVLESSQFILGPEVRAFEDEFAAYCGVRHAVGVNSGTSALHLALLAAGVESGDEVITTPLTFVATVAAIRYINAKPVFVDINPQSFTIDPARIEGAVTSKTKVILPVHLYGQPADMDGVLEVARKHNLIVIEDAAQAHGAEYKGRRAGSIGDLGCFSFYPGKNLGAYGEGGAVVTSNTDYARMVRMLRDWGQEARYEHVLRGYNYRLEGIQGAILRVKLRYLDRWTDGRRERAGRYGECLSGLPLLQPEVMPYAKHAYHIYAVRLDNRERLQAALDGAGIQTGIHYPRPVHLLPAHADLGYRLGDFPNAEQLAAEELSLPIYPELTDQAIEETVREVRAFFKGRSSSVA